MRITREWLAELAHYNAGVRRAVDANRANGCAEAGICVQCQHHNRHGYSRRCSPCNAENKAARAAA